MAPLNTGRYLIVNCKHKNVATLPDANEYSGIVAGVQENSPGEMWNVNLLGNGTYKIQNYGHCLYANGENGFWAKRGDAVIGASYPQQWKIMEMPSKGDYCICPTTNMHVCWSLQDGEDLSSIVLGYPPNSRQNQWNFTRVDDDNFAGASVPSPALQEHIGSTLTAASLIPPAHTPERTPSPQSASMQAQLEKRLAEMEKRLEEEAKQRAMISMPSNNNSWLTDHAVIEMNSKKYSIFNKATHRIWYHADHLRAISTYDNNVVADGIVYNETRSDRQWKFERDSATGGILLRSDYKPLENAVANLKFAPNPTPYRFIRAPVWGNFYFIATELVTEPPKVVTDITNHNGVQLQIVDLDKTDEYQMWELVPSPGPPSWAADHLSIDVTKKYSVFNKATRRIWYHADHLGAISTYDVDSEYNETRTDRQWKFERDPDTGGLLLRSDYKPNENPVEGLKFSRNPTPYRFIRASVPGNFYFISTETRSEPPKVITDITNRNGVRLRIVDMNTADEYQMWELIRSPEPSNWVADHLAIDISRKYAVYNKATRRIWYHADHLDAISTYDIVGIYNQTRADRQWKFERDPGTGGLLLRSDYKRKKNPVEGLKFSRTPTPYRFIRAPVPGNFYFISTETRSEPPMVITDITNRNGVNLKTVKLNTSDEYQMWELVAL